MCTLTPIAALSLVSLGAPNRTKRVLVQSTTGGAPAGFDDDFNSSTLDPARQVVPYACPRAYGYTEPANHVSLADNPRYLRYHVERRTHDLGFLTNHQQTREFDTYYPEDPGLELHRPFSGDNWLLCHGCS